MVKKPREVCLDPYDPIAINKNDRNEKEVVTVIDESPSLYQMVMSGSVGSMPGNTNLYTYPDLGDDEEAHEHPDYMRLDRLDILEKEEFVNNFNLNPNNYEKKVESGETLKTETQGIGSEGEGGEPEPKA